MARLVARLVRGSLLLILLSLVRSNLLSPLCGFFLLVCHGLRLSQRLDPVCGTGKTADAVRDFTATDKRNDNGGANNKGEDESVDTVPFGCPASSGRATVGIVEEVKGEELCDQSVFNGHEDGWPSDCRGNNADGVSGISLASAIVGKFKAPVNGTEEGNDLAEMVRVFTFKSC